ncbi:hypothetical protein Efla_003906 [Eimeria flavescens]
MTAPRQALALPSWHRCFFVLAFVAVHQVSSEGVADKEGSGDGLEGTRPQQEPHSPLEVPPYTEDAPKLATAKLHGLLALLDESRENERRQRELIKTLHAGPAAPTAGPPTSNSPGEQQFAEQLRKKTMVVQHGFTETAAATVLGRRPVDEDAMLLVAPLPGRPGSYVKALFDGHGGHIVARKCSVIAPTFIGRMRDFSGDSFAEASFAMDAALRHDPEVSVVPGSTGIIAVMEAPDPTVPEFVVHVANIGDSRLLVLHQDGTFTPMSVDQKPNDKTEMMRVRQAGGSVVHTAMGVWRIDGRLALSRSFGDFRMKARADLLPSQQKVVALPHKRTLRVRAGDVLVFACDGVFEAQGMDWSFVANFVATQLNATGGNLEETAMRLVTTAYLLGSCDNISAMLVRISPTSFPAARVTAAEVDVLGESETAVVRRKQIEWHFFSSFKNNICDSAGERKERPAMLPSEATPQRSGAWTTDLGLHATLY